MGLILSVATWQADSQYNYWQFFTDDFSLNDCKDSQCHYSVILFFKHLLEILKYKHTVHDEYEIIQNIQNIVTDITFDR